jgi:hypothetical protein
MPLLFIAKISSLVLLLPLICGAVIYFWQVRFVIAILSGAVVTILFLLVNGINFIGISIHQFHFLINTGNMRDTHPIVSTLISNIRQLGNLFIITTLFILIPIIFLIAFRFFILGSKIRFELALLTKYLLAFSLLVSFIFAVCEQVFGNRWTFLGYFLASVAVPGLYSLIKDITSRRFDEIFALKLILFFTPYITALATFNPIGGQFLYMSTPWFLLWGIVMYEEFLRGNLGRFLSAISVLSLCLISLSFLSVDIFRAPYRTAPYFTQGTLMTAGTLKGIYLTEENADWSNWLNNISKKYPGHRVVNIANPGVAFVMDQPTLGSSWLYSADTHWRSLDFACRSDGINFALLLVLPAEATTETYITKLNKNLRSCNISFPQDFRLISVYHGALQATNSQVWTTKKF